MGSSQSYFAEIQSPNDKHFPQVVTCEELMKVVLEAYTLASDPGQEFLCKERELQCLYKKYQCLFDEYEALFYQFIKNAYGYQMLTIIGKVQDWWVNLVTYETACGWVVLPGSPVRRWTDDCNKFQYTVARSRSVPGDWDKYEARKQCINTMITNGTFDYGPNTLIDYRTKPCIQIMEPCDLAKVQCEFWLKVSVTNWRLQDHGKNYKIFVDGCELETVFTEEMVLVRLHGACKGWKKLTVKLYDECNRYAKIKQSVRVKLCQDCDCDGYKKDSSSSSDCGCSSSSSSSECDCRGKRKKKHHKKKCCSSSSSSSSICGCDSSSSSSDCSSSSSSSSCSSSSSSEWCRKCKKNKCCCSSSSSSSEDEPCPDVSRSEVGYYNFQRSYSCPESSSSSEMVVLCGNECDGQVVCQKSGFKCPTLACGKTFSGNRH